MSLNASIFEALNALAGRSWLVDSMIALSLDNIFVKAGPICACFFYAWYAKGDAAAEPARRRILLVTLIALFLIAPVSKTLSERTLAPRPFLAAEQTYLFDEGRLTQAPSVEYRAMQSGDMLERTAELRQGRIASNDLVTFPSDHAALFVALALGILLASRLAGAIALAWALVVTLGSRIVAGMHWPADIAAGALLGAAMLALLQFAFAGRRGRLWEPAVAWTFRYPGLTAVALFLLLLETANTMQTLKRVLELGSALAGRVM